VDLEEARDEFWGRLDQIQDSLSPWEREYANTTPLTMTLRQQIDATWRVEAFQVLVWALGSSKRFLRTMKSPITNWCVRSARERI